MELRLVSQGGHADWAEYVETQEAALGLVVIGGFGRFLVAVLGEEDIEGG